MKLEIGMYVRTENGVIEKVNRIYDRHTTDNIFVWLNACGDGQSVFIDDFEEIKFLSVNSRGFIKKEPSFNIIDLLEVGDIITFKEDEDVYKILQIPNEKCGLKDFYLVKNYDGITEDIFVKYDEMKEYINSILTKEMFFNAEYRVETN